jgi:exopolyphosphatase/guanosine-5'-triphosphate,3'-diphosphate pyrophosphatase
MDSNSFQSNLDFPTQLRASNEIRLAAIDIGTNTILMVIGEKNHDGTLSFIRNEHSIARLGENVSKTKVIKYEAVERAKKVLLNYKRICDDCNVIRISAAGTSALRDAVNRYDVIEELSTIIGTEIKVIPGEEEARLSFIGTIENDRPSIVLDIGGGSTEFIYGENQNVIYRHSLNIGAVRITEKFFKTQPTTENSIHEAESFIIESLNNIDSTTFKGELIGVAGTPTTLAAMTQELTKFEKEKVHNFILEFNTINKIFNKIKTLTVEEIKSLKGIHPERADIITAGTLIIISVMKYFRIDKCTVSTRGLRYGILIDMASNL